MSTASVKIASITINALETVELLPMITALIMPKKMNEHAHLDFSSRNG